MNYAQLDFERQHRTGLPEVVYGEGKSRAQIVEIVSAMRDRSPFVLATRTDSEAGASLCKRFPEGRYDESARAFAIGCLPASGASIGIVCAGTSDMPVADEASFVAEALGHQVIRYNDVGVAGLHRVLTKIDALDATDVVIVVAGMEGALPSVVAGLIHPPVIAVPTSVGYGASFGGITALLGMLVACAPGISVVNIDNGFGAAVVAHKIASRRGSPRQLTGESSHLTAASPSGD